ncbi:hypothetical protein HYE68_006944 [Fusarium pseudograminearum]|nr:hypothetical protein HYE68_006944 [Fusarium pseudograminearum]
MSETKDLSSQVQDTTKDTASNEQQSSGAFGSPQRSLPLIVPIAVNYDQSVPRSGVVNDAGDILDDAGKTVGKVADTDNLKDLVGNTVNSAGDVVDSSGDVLGKTLPIGQGKPEEEEDSHDEEKSEYTTQSKDKKSGGLGDAVGGVTSAVGDTAKSATDTVGETTKGATDTVGDPEEVEEKLQEKTEGAKDEATKSEVPEGDVAKTEAPVDEVPSGEVADDDKSKTAETEEAVDEKTAEAEEAAKEPLDFSVLKGTTVDKEGNLVNDKGDKIGKIVEGELKQLVGLSCDDQGQIWDKTGKQLGKAEPIPDDKGDTIGKVTEGEIKQLVGLKSDENGKIWRDGKVVGQAEPLPEWERVQKKDRSVLKGSKVNKVGKLVDSNGNIVGKVVEGDLKELLGKRSDENGDIWNDSGEVIGKGEPVSASEREQKSSAPFENFPDAIVESDGRVMYNGEQVGEVIEGNPKELKGSKVDEDGDILDRRGNSVGKAKRWEAPEAEEEKPVDNSALAGKRVNKAGNLVSESGEIYGRVIEGNVQKLVGRMSDRDGNIRSESGDIIGKAELVSEGERGGKKDGPFAELKNCTVAKDGKVVNQAGETVGRLVIGDAKALVGRSVDDDGEIVDSNGNVIGKAERWEEPEKEKSHNPLAGRKVNREGNVADADGNIIGKLTSGEILDCQGKEVDEDGDVFNQKGSVVGHVSLLEDIPKEEEPEEEPTPEPEGETEEERIKREQAEADIKAEQDEAEKNKKLAQQLAYQIEQTLERLRPICKSINDKISAAEAKKPEDRDEEELVRQVKPLIEDGGKLLTETNGIIRGLDPDGRIARNAKQKSSSGEATPEEAHLANLLKELSTEIQTCIDESKRKLEGMPHAKKEINPLWGLLAEPLFQIVAAVGLLLSGVLGLVGKLLGPILGPLLNGLGLGGLLDGLLGGLGLKKILGSLGLGDVVGTVTGKK